MTTASSADNTSGAVGPSIAHRWVLVVGSILGGLTLLYLMGILVVILLIRPVEGDAARFLLLGILALGIGLSSAFLGGYVAVSGHARIPFVRAQEHPVRFAAGGGLLAVFVSLWVGMIIWPRDVKDSRTKAEHAIDELSSKVIKRWGEFESVTDDKSTSPREGGQDQAIHIKEMSIRLASDLQDVDEQTLGYAYLVTKWQYISYSYCIAASLEDNNAKRLQLAKRASWATEYSLTLVEEARARANKGKAGYRAVADFLEGDSAESRIRYLIALGLVIRYYSSDPAISREDVRDAISKIPESFQHRVPINWNPWFRKYLDVDSSKKEEPLVGKK